MKRKNKVDRMVNLCYIVVMKDCRTQYRIMATAMDLIWRSSYDSVGVGDICKQAQVNKGSFYHFFPSKEMLAVEALKEHWDVLKPKMDSIFSPQNDPIRRLMDYCGFILKAQREQQEKIGYICGCPYTNLGLEQCSRSKEIQQTVETCLKCTKKYFYSAIRDAAEDGVIQVSHVSKKTDELFTYYIGATTQAQLFNDIKYIEGLKRGFKNILDIY